MGVLVELEAAKAEVARLETEITTLPAALVGKTEQEMADLWHTIKGYFKGAVPDPMPVAVEPPAA